MKLTEINGICIADDFLLSHIQSILMKFNCHVVHWLTSFFIELIERWCEWLNQICSKKVTGTLPSIPK